MMFSYYYESELKQSLELVKEKREVLGDLIDEVNGLLAESGSVHRYAVWAREFTLPKKWPWHVEKKELRVELLFGIPDTMCEMQILNLPSAGFEATLFGFINGYNAVKKQVPPEEMWKKFINLLNDVDDLETKSFIGSTDRYKKIFVKANP